MAEDFCKNRNHIKFLEHKNGVRFFAVLTTMLTIKQADDIKPASAES